MLQHINIVLVNTSHPGNIGSAARAMKTMGLKKLTLVAPEHFPDPKAIEMAASAADILENATCVATLQEATQHASLVIGTSARDRALPWPMLLPRELATLAMGDNRSQEVAIAFGRERTGLTNEELQLCHYHVMIPANPEYSSLNLAAAVQVICYELRMAALNLPSTLQEEAWDFRYATSEEMNQFFNHLENTLMHLDFLKKTAPRKLMPRLKRLFLRTRPDVMEINILRGILSAVLNTERKEHA